MTPDTSSPREDAFHSTLHVVLTELHAMARSIAEHELEVRMDLQTIRDLVQGLSRMEPRLRAQQVLNARLPNHEEKKYTPDTNLFGCEPPAYEPTIVCPFSPSTAYGTVKSEAALSAL